MQDLFFFGLKLGKKMEMLELNRGRDSASAMTIDEGETCLWSVCYKDLQYCIIVADSSINFSDNSIS